eukprot:jgi/Mesen1/3182/ME000184S02244
MARNAETTMYLLDVSPSMHQYFQEVKQYMEEQMMQKNLFNTKDEVAIITFGSNETDNELHAEPDDGYKHVAVALPLQPVSQEVFAVLEHLRPGDAPGDFVNAEFVAVDMLVKALEAKTTKKGNKRLVLLTAAASPLEAPWEGTTAEQVQVLAGHMAKHSCKLDASLGSGLSHYSAAGGAAGSADVAGAAGDTRAENERLLQLMVDETHGDVRRVESPRRLLNRMRPRVAAVTSFRGELEVTPSLSIKVWVYKKTAQQRLPSLKMFSDKAPESDPTATRAVRLEREYKLSTDPDKVVPPDQQVKAYRYGPQIVPIGPLEREVVLFQAEKGIKLLGFTLRASIPRHYYMGEASIFLPEPDNVKSATAVSALARALHAEGKVAIVRCKLQDRKGLGVTLGCLTPRLSPDDETDGDSSIPDSLYFNVLPFAEDIREFPFKSFSEKPAAQQPSQLQHAVAAALVSALDLSPSPKRPEAYLPEDTPNPVLQRFYKFVHQRVVSPEAELAPLDESLRECVEPDPALLKQACGELARFADAFPLKAAIGKKQKGAASFWRDRIAEGKAREQEKAPGGGEARDGGGGGADESDTVSQISVDHLASKAPERVGQAAPVQDFEAMLARSDGDSWVPKAMEEMRALIVHLLDTAYNGNTHDKCLQCLSALRRGCIVQEEPKEFNLFLRELEAKCRGRRQYDAFWGMIVEHKITLIDTSEVEDSDATREDAERFLEGRAQVPGADESNGGEEEPDVDDLLDDVD